MFESLVCSALRKEGGHSSELSLAGSTGLHHSYGSRPTASHIDYDCGGGAHVAWREVMTADMCVVHTCPTFANEVYTLSSRAIGFDLLQCDCSFLDPT